MPHGQQNVKKHQRKNMSTCLLWTWQPHKKNSHFVLCLSSVTYGRSESGMKLHYKYGYQLCLLYKPTNMWRTERLYLRRLSIRKQYKQYCNTFSDNYYERVKINNNNNNKILSLFEDSMAVRTENLAFRHVFMVPKTIKTHY